MKRLSTMESRLLAFMRDRGYGVDVPIDDMFDCLLMLVTSAKTVYVTRVMRERQHYVGAFVSRINRKQNEYEIVPGKLKRTYRVQRKRTLLHDYA